jgi:hypothetical protein
MTRPRGAPLRAPSPPRACSPPPPLTLAHAADDWKLDSDTFEGAARRHLGPGVMSGRIAASTASRANATRCGWEPAGGGGRVAARRTTARPGARCSMARSMSIGAIRVVAQRIPKYRVGRDGRDVGAEQCRLRRRVYRTTDGGDTWTTHGTRDDRAHRAHRRAPTNRPDRSWPRPGPLFADSPERGVYRSTRRRQDVGRRHSTWTRAPVRRT